MSFYDDASLVVIPRGYKTSKVYSVKPTSGDGDLTFTRSNATATRVGPDGLIEKVRTNLMPQSNTFSNATWNKVNSTVTSGQSGYDATSNAWLLTDDATSAAHSITQFTRWATTLQTGSVYVKAGTNTKAYIGNATTNRGAFFNLSTGTLEGTIGTVVSQSIVSVGSGWYRISVTLESAGTFIIGSYQTFVAGNFPSSIAYSGSGSNILIQNSQLEAGDIATPYIGPTLGSAVSVGPVANVPRLDYLNSSCPRLLLEPQRTNINLFSEDLTNAFYGKTNTTITANSIVSPDGFQNADTATFAVGGNLNYFYSFAGNSSVAFSFFVKKGNYTSINVLEQFYFATSITFNLDAKTATAGGKVEDYGNGWLRCSWVQAYGAAQTIISWRFAEAAGAAGFAYFYGFQAEAGAYATSYIPTLGAAVTRGQESSSKTSASALIGQTEGTLYSEFVVNGFADFGTALCINDGGTGESIWLTTFANGDIRAEVYSNAGGGVQASFTKSGNVVGQTYKIAIGYAVNNFSFFVNGVQVGATDLLGTIPVGMNRVDFDYTVPSSFVQSALAIKQALLFKTRLSNAQLAELTA